MSSCNWEKYKNSTHIKRVFRHCDSTMRLQDEHANVHIDKSLTDLNMSFGIAKDGYSALCNAYDRYMNELDSKPNANKRKDRVTCVSLSISCPKDMSNSQARQWGNDVYELLQANFQGRLLGGQMHFDEVHEYIDVNTKKRVRSRPHMHIFVIPEVDGKLNAKSFTAKRNMVSLNNQIHKMTQQSYGYDFMDGSRRKSKKSVEELKNDSAVLEAREQAQDYLDDARTRSNALIRDAQLKSDTIIANANNFRSEAYEGLQKVKDIKSQYDMLNTLLQEYQQAISDYDLAKQHFDTLAKFMKSKSIKHNGVRKTLYELYEDSLSVDNKLSTAKIDQHKAKHAERKELSEEIKRKERQLFDLVEKIERNRSHETIGFDF